MRDSIVFFSTDGYGFRKMWVILGFLRWGYVMLLYVSTQCVLSVATAWVLDFILHILFVIDAFALLSILPLLSLTLMVYCTPETNGRLRRFIASASILDFCGYRSSITLWNVIVIELCDSFLLSVIQTVLSNFSVLWSCGLAHTFYKINCMNLTVYYFIRAWVLQSLGEFSLGYFRLC
jgi:hypothetical protein